MATYGGLKRWANGLLAVAIVAVAAAGCSATKNKPKGSVVSDKLQVVNLTDGLKVDTIDMGRVRTGEVVSRNIALKGSDSGPTLITSTDTSCGCLELACPDEPIAIGGKVVAEMTFYSAGYNYFVPRSFTIYSSSGVAKRLVVVATME